MAYQTIQEGNVVIQRAPGKVTKKLPVFYNPVMALQRNVNVALIASLKRKNLRIADVLAGSGVRSARLLLEVPGKVEHIDINDANPSAVPLIKKNLTANKAPKKYAVHNKDASQLLLESSGYDYIDIDPYGSPNPFLDAACKRVSRGGIIALTATDTAALAGTSPAACSRKYWARPLLNEFKHETGMRILARKAQLVAAQYEKALTPVYCHSTAHYLRLYLRAEKSKKALKPVLNGHQHVQYCFTCLKRTISRFTEPKKCCGKQMSVAGPLWTGKLWDAALAKNSVAYSTRFGTETQRLTATIAEESRINAMPHYHTHWIAKKHKRALPKQEKILEKLRNKNIPAAPSHFAQASIRTPATLQQIKNALARR